jgi:hypothetical protein
MVRLASAAVKSAGDALRVQNVLLSNKMREAEAPSTCAPGR